MNDFELESMLKNSPVPERTERYWSHFPVKTRCQLRHRQAPPPPFEDCPRRMAWSFALGAVCLVTVALGLRQPLEAFSIAVMQKETTLCHHINGFPKHLESMMTDEHGLHYLIADKE